MRMVLATILLIFGASLPASAQSVAGPLDDEAPAVGFCDLLHDADKYNGKTVRIETTYEHGIHMATFYNPTCMMPSGLPFTAKVSFADDRDGTAALNKISKFLKHSRTNEVPVTVIGVFRMENPAGAVNTDFARYAFEVKRLLSAGGARLPTQAKQ